MTAPLPSIGVIVPTYNRNTPLCECLGDLFQQETAPDEIIVVDQSSSHDEPTARFLATHAGRFLHVRHPVPNLPGARNVGLTHCRSEIVVFVDDDARFAPGFVGHHRANYQDPAIMAVAGPVLENPDSWLDTLPLWAADPFTRRFTGCWQYRHRHDVFHAPGGNMSFRRHLLEQVGRFDDGYAGPAFREETDFFLRFTSAGHRVVYDPECWILHHSGPKVGGCWDSAGRLRKKQRAGNEARFAVKNFAAHHLPRLFWRAARAGWSHPLDIPMGLLITLGAWGHALRTVPRHPIVP